MTSTMNAWTPDAIADANREAVERMTSAHPRLTTVAGV